jgi:hypothetical protein
LGRALSTDGRSQERKIPEVGRISGVWNKATFDNLRGQAAADRRLALAHVATWLADDCADSAGRSAQNEKKYAVGS